MIRSFLCEAIDLRRVFGARESVCDLPLVVESQQVFDVNSVLCKFLAVASTQKILILGRAIASDP